ncbi:TPA: hypothetical protein I7756_21810 [Vibrio vulnificus]|nr:hypothetical protein [Vibrio vulnificus]
MTLQELFNSREGVEARINQYWTFWSVSVFAVCGGVFSGEEPRLAGTEPWFIVCGLTIFFVANLSVLFNATKLSLLLHDEMCLKSSLENVSDDFKVRLKTGEVKFRLELTVIMHVIIDIAVISVVIVHGAK